MIIARVIGRTVSSRKDEGLLGSKLLLVEEVDPHGAGSGDMVVASDHIGAGPGDVVLVAQGSAARNTAATKEQPVDALVVGIVDTIRMDGRTAFTSTAGFSSNGVKQ